MSVFWNFPRLHLKLTSPCWAVLLVACTFFACEKKKAEQERVNIYVDLTFKPVIEQQYIVFQDKFGDKQQTSMVYATESEAFQALLDHKTTMIITSRPVHQKEKQQFIQQDSAVPYSAIVAYDMLILLLSKDHLNTDYTLQELKHLLTQKSDTTLLFEGKTASSSLLFLMDTLGISLEQNIPPNIVGTKNAQQIMDFIQTHPKSIGIIGSTSLSPLGETPKMSLQKIGGVHVARLYNEKLHLFASPTKAEQFNFSSYPLVRPIYYTTTDVVSGPGIRFGRFMSNEQGQLIFEKSHAFPARMNFVERKATIKK